MRIAIMLGSMLEALVRFGPIYLMSRGRVSGARRAAWVHESFARLARRLSLVPSVPPPQAERAPASWSLTI